MMSICCTVTTFHECLNFAWSLTLATEKTQLLFYSSWYLEIIFDAGDFQSYIKLEHMSF